jgi:hypothetical protein
MNDDPIKPESQKRLWPWFLLAGVILWIALSVFWMWREVQRVKRQKLAVIELREHRADTPLKAAHSPATQNKWRSPRMRRRFAAGTGEAMMRSPIGLSASNSNLSSTRATNTVPSSRAA